MDYTVKNVVMDRADKNGGARYITDPAPSAGPSAHPGSDQPHVRQST